MRRLNDRQCAVLASAQHAYKTMGWIISSNHKHCPKRTCEALVRFDLLAPLHERAELTDDDGFKAWTKRGKERFVRGQCYQLTVQGLEYDCATG